MTTMLTIQWRGREWTLTELSVEVGIDRRTLQCRLNRGETVEAAVSRPARTYPDGVRRERGMRRAPPPPPQPQLCARCMRRESSVLVVSPIGQEWRACSACARAAHAALADWAGRW